MPRQCWASRPWPMRWRTPGRTPASTASTTPSSWKGDVAKVLRAVAEGVAGASLGGRQARRHRRRSAAGRSDRQGHHPHRRSGRAEDRLRLLQPSHHGTERREAAGVRLPPGPRHPSGHVPAHPARGVRGAARARLIQIEVLLLRAQADILGRRLPDMAAEVVVSSADPVVSAPQEPATTGNRTASSRAPSQHGRLVQKERPFVASSRPQPQAC